MGISIVQFRSRFSSHDNLGENKRCLGVFKGSFLEYNVYIPLLIRQANDVEENPGPTIFDITDPMRTVSADYSQGNEALFGENAGKQCVAMSLTAIIYHQIEQVSNWTSSTLNNILTIGNNPYISIKQRISSYTTDHKIVLDHIYTNMSHLHVDTKTGV